HAATESPEEQARVTIAINYNGTKQCHPGYVNTDTTSHHNPPTIEEGADTPTYLATLEGNDGPTGRLKIARDCKGSMWRGKRTKIKCGKGARLKIHDQWLIVSWSRNWNICSRDISYRFTTKKVFTDAFR
ncbi:unnamed protein product, partial [Cercopithifilaria johnstoni]